MSLVASALVVLSLSTLGVTAADVDEGHHAWQYRRALTGLPAAARPAAVPAVGSVVLPPEVLARAQRGLGDLRLVDEGGEERPYALVTARPPAPCHGELVSVSRREKIASSWTVALRPACTFRALRLGLEAHDFAKTVGVEVSDDAKNWTVVVAQGATVFDQRFGDRVVHEDRVALPSVRTAAFVRVSLDDVASPPVEVRDVEAIAASEPRVRWRRELQAGPPVKDGEWRVYALAAGGLPFDELELLTSERMFVREATLVAHSVDGGGHAVETVVGAGTLYRQLGPTGTAARERLVLEAGPTPAGASLLLRVRDRDDRALDHLRVAASGPEQRLVFSLVDGVPRTLYYGNPQTRAAGYDLTALAETLAPEVELALGAEEPNPRFRTQPPLSFVDARGASLELAPFAWQRTLTLADGDDIYAVVLEPADLARVRPDLGDLRLVDASGAQIPFVMERRVAERRVELEVSPAAAPGRRGVSRWALRVPALAEGESLPVAALEVEAVEHFFSRPVFVTTPLADGGRRVVFAGRLERAEGREGPLVLPLTGVRARDLMLEVEDGDNAPLAVSRVAARVTVPRLAFKAKGPAAGLRLVFGASRVAPPSYDLAALTAEVLAYAARPVTVGPVEKNPAHRTSLTDGGDFTVQRTVLWIALVVLVAGLLLVIVRMVRKLVP